MAQQPYTGGHMLAHVANVGRMLATEQEESEFDIGGRMSQMMSGCMFAAMSVYLLMSNNRNMKDIQAASFETRLKTCCHINAMIAALSAFLNFFQLTELDNYMLPGQNNVTVDVARPIEWLLTCPLMQLSLVLMGGSKIPGYRRKLMPGLASTVLLIGTSTLFVEDTVARIFLFFLGVCVHLTAMFFNRRQIMEHSDGVEGLFTGESEYRKCTLILMMTWFPFPIWFFLSPEGLGIIDDLVIVQMGWAVLNIGAKFSFMIVIQRFKDNYYYHMQLTRFKREMSGKGELPDYMRDDVEGFDQKIMYNINGGEEPMPGAIMRQQSPMAPPHGSTAVDMSMPALEFSGSALECKLAELEARLGSKLEVSFEKIDIAIQKLGDRESDEKAHKELVESFAGSQECIRDRVNCGLSDVEKKVEKVHWLTQTSNNMLELKVETAFASHFKEQQEMQTEIRSMLEELPQLLVKHASETHSTTTSVLGELQQSLQQSMGGMQQTMVEFQASQSAMSEMISGGSLSEMTDGWAAQIILETKTAAFETQTKIGSVELTSNKRHAEGMEAITGQLEQFVNEGMKKMAGAVMQTTLKSSEELQASIEALHTNRRSESSNFQQILTQQIEGMNQDFAKHVEASSGVFANSIDSLRAQLQTLQSQQVASESNMGTKWDGLMAPIQQHLQAQVDQMHQKLERMIQENLESASNDHAGVFKELKGYMEEEARSQQGRHQDISSVFDTVLEQSCGAKTSAEECATNLAKLQTNLATQDNDYAIPPHHHGHAQVTRNSDAGSDYSGSKMYSDGGDRSGGVSPSRHVNTNLRGNPGSPKSNGARSGNTTPTRAGKGEPRTQSLEDIKSPRDTDSAASMRRAPDPDAKKRGAMM